MPISIAINGSVTLDESGALQDSGIAAPPEDNNDSDVLLSTLPTAFSDRLFVDLALDDQFADDNGVAHSAGNYISLSGTGDVVSLGFTDSSGAALPVYGVDLVGSACNLTALDGGAITLFADSVLGNQVVYGVDTQGHIVFAMYMDVASDLLSASVWTVQFEALDNPVDTNHDDPLEMTGLGVGAGTTTEFNFDELPSGANLFGMLGSGTSGLIVFGTTTVLKNDGTYKNPGSDVIQTSQAGPNATIGINSQMFDAGESAYFTYVKNPDANFTSSNLSPNEADDADNLLYGDGNAATDDTIEATSAFLEVAQIQSGTVASMSITAYDIDGSPQGRDLLLESGGDAVAVTRVVVYAADGTTVLDDSDDPAGDNANISFSFSGGVATVTGIEAGYRIEWYTSAPHDQVKIAGVTGKFDIGGFGVNEASSVSAPLTGVRFEDDGPSVDLELAGDAELRVDESTLPVMDSITAADLFSTNTADFGTDGAGADGSVYALVLGNANSGLFDTATQDEVILSINSDGTLITGEVNDGVDDVTVFTIAIDADTGEVTLTQSRAMVNGDITDPDESDTPLTLDPGTVSVQRTLTDGDDDTASDSVDISGIMLFEDAGPLLPGGDPQGLELRTDDSDILDSATLSTDVIFPLPPVYGSDGPHAINPLDFSLRLVTDNGDSGLVDTATGRAIRFKSVGDDIVGFVDSNGDGVIGAGETLEAVRYSLTADDADTETVTFSQSRGVFHALADPVDTVNANLVFVDRVAIDGDGDPSDVNSFDLGAISILEDDEPTIGPISDGLVDFALNSTVTNTLDGAVGNDPNSSPYILTAFTPSVVVNGVTVTGVLSADETSVTYWANTNGNGVIGDAGDTAYYELELGDQGGAGDYTFTVLIDPPPSFTPFDFTDLPSGQNLFGCIAANKSNLDGMALFVISKTADVNNPGDGQMTNVSGTVNTSKGGGPVTIGDGNQMYDPGEGAYFVYLSNPDDDMVAGVPGGLTQNTADDADTIGFADTVEVTTASVEIVQTQGNALATMNVKAFDIDMAPFGAGGVNTDAEARSFAEDPEATDDQVNVTGVRVLNSSGVLLESWADTNLDGVYELQDIPGADNHPQVNVEFIETSVGSGIYYARVSGVNQGYTIEFDTEIGHDMALVEGVAGKFDIGGFNIFQGNDTPDQLLSFTAQVLDGDGDTDTASWDIGIDGTGIHDDDSVSGIVI